jgi:hypothetical protein
MSSAASVLPGLARFSWRDTHRLVAAHYPPTGILDILASPEDLPALLELEGWTDDRIAHDLGLLPRLPREEWVTGAPHAHVVMAAFCHPAPGGARFSDQARGAWYAARELETSHAESIHRRRQALAEIGAFETVMHLRLWMADFDGEFHDLTPSRRKYAPYYDPSSYAASQSLARELLAQGSRGIVYRSVRRKGGKCLACFRPRAVKNVRDAAIYEYRWSGRPDPAIRNLSAPAR